MEPPPGLYFIITLPLIPRVRCYLPPCNFFWGSCRGFLLLLPQNPHILVSFKKLALSFLCLLWTQIILCIWINSTWKTLPIFLIIYKIFGLTSISNYTHSRWYCRSCSYLFLNISTSSRSLGKSWSFGLYRECPYSLNRESRGSAVYGNYSEST